MDQSSVLQLSRHALEVCLLIAMPLLAVSLFVGIIVSVFQAATQIQEMTLTFVPKLIGIAIVVAMMGSWMLTTIVSFTHDCIQMAGNVTHY